VVEGNATVISIRSKCGITRHWQWCNCLLCFVLCFISSKCLLNEISFHQKIWTLL